MTAKKNKSIPVTLYYMGLEYDEAVKKLYSTFLTEDNRKVYFSKSTHFSIGYAYEAQKIGDNIQLDMRRPKWLDRDTHKDVDAWQISSRAAALSAKRVADISKAERSPWIMEDIKTLTSYLKTLSSGRSRKLILDWILDVVESDIRKDWVANLNKKIPKIIKRIKKK